MPSRNPEGLSPLKRFLFATAAFAAVPLVTLALLEGGSSLLLTGRQIVRTASATAAASRWLEHHPRIGPVPRPNFYEPDMYGPGVYFRTNAQGFRNLRDFPPDVPVGSVRLICSGDSYTLGQEVANGEPWCDRLTDLHASLETVNLGVSGYGWDQAFLRYRHQGAELQHDLHLFAFITDDLYRMRRTNWRWVWDRPLLAVRNGALAAPDAVPCVPCRHPLLAAVAAGVGRLQSVELLAALGRRAGLRRPVDRERELRELAEHTVRELAGGGVPLVLVHLPVIEDYVGDHSGPWREYLAETAAREGAGYVDLIDPLRRLPADSIPIIFLPAHVDRGRHYTAAGHDWIASQLYARISDRLEGLSAQRSRLAHAAD